MSLQAGNADDLALPNLKGDRVAEAVEHPSVKLEKRCAGMGVFAGRLVDLLLQDVSARHLGQEGVRLDLVHAVGVKDVAVAHDGNGVADGIQLRHAVGNENDDTVFLLEGENGAAHLFNVGVVQRRGDLVDNQHVGVGKQCLGKFDHVLLAGGQRVDLFVAQLGDLQLLHHRLGALFDLPTVGKAALAGNVADAQILRYGQIRQKAQLLTGHHDLFALCRLGGIHAVRLAVEREGALVGLDSTGKDLCDRALAGAVAAE